MFEPLLGRETHQFLGFLIEPSLPNRRFEGPHRSLQK